MFKIDSEAGTWSLKSGEEELTGCKITIGDNSVLEGADIQESPEGSAATRIRDGLQTDVKFINNNKGWSSIDFSIKNVSKYIQYVPRITMFAHPLYSCFRNKDAELAFCGEIGKWTDLTGKSGSALSPIVGSLSQGLSKPAWVVGFDVPQHWPGNVDAFISPYHPEKSFFQAFVNQGVVPYRMEPDEELVFDTMVLSCKHNTLNGLQAFGKRCTPRTPVTKTQELSGYNTWEYYRKDITAKECLKDLEALVSNDKTKDKVRYFILDHGWQKACGDWVFDVDKFGMDAKEWAGCVQDKGMIPGLWVGPFLADRSVIRKLGIEPLCTGWGNTLVMDPSDPVVIDHVCGQLKDLVDAGIRYFKTDFLTQANKPGMLPYRHSNRPGQTVLRNFFKCLREAIGEETFWLACGTDVVSCAGVVDMARIGGDIKANWQLVKNHLLHKVMGRFWMHGSYWINDADFLTVKGDHLKPDSPVRTQWTTGFVPYKGGFTHDEAVLWASLLVITGSLMTWSDSPGAIDDAGVDIVSRCYDHCGGESGIPLDFGKVRYPERWVKKDGDKLYIAFFNFDDEEKTHSLSSEELPELKDNPQFKDIFSDEEYRVSSSRMEISLRPHSAKCLLQTKLFG